MNQHYIPGCMLGAMSPEDETGKRKICKRLFMAEIGSEKTEANQKKEVMRNKSPDIPLEYGGVECPDPRRLNKTTWCPYGYAESA